MCIPVCPDLSVQKFRTVTELTLSSLEVCTGPVARDPYHAKWNSGILQPITFNHKIMFRQPNLPTNFQMPDTSLERKCFTKCDQ